jgi:hypothetical protein
MNRREAVIGLGALAVSACAGSEITPPEVMPPLTMNVSVFCGWATPRPEYGSVPGTQSPWANPWESLRTNDRTPLMGEYNEALPEITERRCEMMEYGVIGCAVYQVEMKKAA